jgi:hypothetical protein
MTLRRQHVEVGGYDRSDVRHRSGARRTRTG